MKNDHAQRIVTTIGLANPIRYRMWMPSHSSQAMNQANRAEITRPTMPTHDVIDSDL